MVYLTNKFDDLLSQIDNVLHEKKENFATLRKNVTQ